MTVQIPPHPSSCYISCVQRRRRRGSTFLEQLHTTTHLQCYNVCPSGGASPSNHCTCLPSQPCPYCCSPSLMGRSDKTPNESFPAVPRVFKRATPRPELIFLLCSPVRTLHAPFAVVPTVFKCYIQSIKVSAPYNLPTTAQIPATLFLQQKKRRVVFGPATDSASAFASCINVPKHAHSHIYGFEAAAC